MPSLATWVTDGEVADVLGGPPDRAELLHHNPLNAVTGGIWRVTVGDATAICKIVTDGSRFDSPEHWEASQDERHFNYWRREIEAYASDLAGDLRPDGVDAPRLLGLDQRAQESVLWLEDVEGYLGTGWDVPAFASFAADLGRAQGRMTAAGGWDRRFLSQGFLAAYAESKPVDERLLAADAAWSRPRIAQHLAELREPLERLHHNRRRFYELAARCPRTLCHLDVWPANLMRRLVDGSFVLVDWSFCGDGALGEDVANLIPDSVFDLLQPVDRLEELAERIEEAYIEGVAEGGWHGDERWIRLGIRASAVKYHWLVGSLLRDADRDDAVAYGGVKVDIDELYAARAAGLRLLCRWAEEAEALAFVLGLPQ